MNKNEIINKLRFHEAQCIDYHKHKETITWTALGVYVAFITAIITLILSNELSLISKVFIAILEVIVSCIFCVFIALQLKWKKYELSAMNSAEIIVTKLLNNEVEAEDIDCSIPEKQFLPKAILIEMGWDETRNRVSFNNAGVQKFTTSYVFFSILSLMLMSIVALLLT